MRPYGVRAASAAPPPLEAARRAGGSTMAIAVVLACAIGAAPGYFFGKSTGAAEERAAISEELQDVQTQSGRRAEELAELRRDLDAHAHTAKLLAARHLLHRSLVALHEGNFGIATELVREAGEAITELSDKDDRFTELAEELRSVTLVVTQDIHDQAMWLAGLGTSLDELVEAD